MNIPKKDKGIRRENNLMMEGFIHHLNEDEAARGTSGYFGGPDKSSIGGPNDDGQRLDLETGDMSFRDTEKGNWDEESRTLSAFKKVALLVQELSEELSEEEVMAFHEMIRSGLDEQSIR